jgi:hypothetical protein
MLMNTDKEKDNAEKELDFDDEALVDVEISDKDIELEDQKINKAKKKAKKESKKHLSADEKKKIRKKKIIIFSVLIIIICVVLLSVPRTRWPILNFIGFRSDINIQINEDRSKSPITGVFLSLENGSTAISDEFGKATFRHTTLGPHTLQLEKNGFGKTEQKIENGLNNNYSTINLKIVGIKLDVVIKDWLSGQPINGAVVKYQKNSATSDKAGLASLVIHPTDERSVDLGISGQGYLPKILNTEVAIASREVSLVSDQKNYFISKRDGKFDIFVSNLDGSGQRKIIEATSKESDSLLQFSISRNNQKAILIANRDGKVTSSRMVAGVYVIDLEKATLQKIDEGSDIQFFGWADDNAVYSKTDPNLKYDDASFTKLQSYSIAKSKLTEIAQTNYLQVGLAAQNKVFYLPSDSYREVTNAVLTSFDFSNQSRRTYLADKVINYATRASFNSIEIQDSSGANYELQISNGAVKAIDRQPRDDIKFASKHDGGQVLWVDKRDGQGALLIRSATANDERVVVKLGGLTWPVRFVGDRLAIARVVTSQETSDYVIDLPSSKISKIVDVSNVGSNFGYGL